MTKGKTRIIGAIVMAITILFAASFFMSKPKAAAAEEFPSVNLENVAVHNVAHANDSSVSTENNTERETENQEVKTLAVTDNVDAAVKPACQHDWEHSHKNPTCESEGYDKNVCILCGEEQFTTIPCCGHTEGEWIITVQPTEEADGVRLKDCIYCDIILYFENFR